MSFGAPFGRIFTPPFGPRLAEAGGGDWWLAGDIDAEDCIAAYYPIGAASLAASYVNLANAGTNDMVTSAAPDWSDSRGWYKDTGTALLSNGYTLTSNDYSVVIKLTNPAGEGGLPIQAYTVWNRRFSIQLRSGKVCQFMVSGGQLTNKSSSDYTAVVAMTSADAWIDKTDMGNLSPSSAIESAALTIDWNSLPMDIHAWAFYAGAITAAQVSAITDAINAL